MKPRPLNFDASGEYDKIRLYSAPHQKFVSGTFQFAVEFVRLKGIPQPMLPPFFLKHPTMIRGIHTT